MDRRIIAAAVIVVILICIAAFILSRPITGTWVCTQPLTQSAMLMDEVTVITLRPDGTAGFRSYGDYLGRFEIRDGSGRWEPMGSDEYNIIITQGYSSSCTYYSNCSSATIASFSFPVEYDRIRDTVIYTEAGAPQFSGRWPFVRSVERDCSGPDGCPGY